MEQRKVIERRTTVTDASVPNGQTTNVNVHPDGGADVQVNEVNEVNEAEPVVEERTTVTTRREI